MILRFDDYSTPLLNDIAIVFLQMAAYSYDINSPVDEDARELIANLLRPDPTDRMSTKEALKFSWLSQ